MTINFTKHAVIRMQERGISEDEVYEVFENPALVLKRGETIVIGRTMKRRYLSLVMDIRGGRLLTLWPASRAQRRLYREKMEKGGV
ncbi:MAG: DUF4258 domain-containing protein [Deltaproteobacteria bacterium]|nr:DUF4258 domain-containing protein [Deltaproteobacteria bacterium]